MTQWWPVSYKLRYTTFGGRHERDNAIAMHRKSMVRVRELVPGGNLLECKVQDGWGSLCEFLGEMQLEGTFPMVNESAELAVLIRDIRWGLLMKAAERERLWVAALGVAGMGFCGR